MDLGKLSDLSPALSTNDVVCVQHPIRTLRFIFTRTAPGGPCGRALGFLYNSTWHGPSMLTGEVTSVHRRGAQPGSVLTSAQVPGPQRAACRTLTASPPPAEGEPGQLLLTDGVGVTQDGLSLRQERYVKKQLPDVLS